MKLTPYGRAIKKGLIDREMTQAELCRRIGCSEETYLIKIMTGQRSGEKYHDAIRDVLGVAYVRRPERIERGA
jgi:transcriptional regulator with XRE-family HTH domain